MAAKALGRIEAGGLLPPAFLALLLPYRRQ
jgi:hypothetical protein